MSLVPNFLLKQSQAILEQCAFGVCIADKNGVMTRVNRSFEKITGLKSTHFIGLHVKQAVDLRIIDNSSILKIMEDSQKSRSRVKTMAGKELISNAFVVYDENKEINLFATIMRNVDSQDAPNEMDLTPNTDNSHNPTTNIVGSSREIRETLDQAKRLSCFDCSVLIEGETGVGKGLFAEFIHKSSPRSKQPFITINCAAIPCHLLESELFGYTYGAFTGANPKGKKGLFEEADGGTIFLDEIGELPMELQAKLLRVIEKRTIHKIGTLEEKKIDVRIIAATNRNLLERISQKEFRSDLFYRLNVVSINIPPLRKRRIDIPDLVDYYLHLHNNQYGTSKNIGAAAQDVFLNYNWPGNVRELSNLMERTVITTRNNTISPEDLPSNILTSNHPQLTPTNYLPGISKNKIKTLKQELDAHEKKILETALNSFNTQIVAAKELGISMSTLTRKLQKHKISLRNKYGGS